MRLYLINSFNPLVSLIKDKESRWNRYRVWKPLSLMVLAGLTPPEREILIMDENLGLQDARAGCLKRRCDGGFAEINNVPAARHDFLGEGYAFGAIQTTRGCPLNGTFCSVMAFNGASFLQRPIADLVWEFQQIPEKHILVVDGNLIGTRPDHIARAKNLFHALAQANLQKQWIAPGFRCRSESRLPFFKYPNSQNRLKGAA